MMCDGWDGDVCDVGVCVNGGVMWWCVNEWMLIVEGDDDDCERRMIEWCGDVDGDVDDDVNVGGGVGGFVWDCESWW